MTKRMSDYRREYGNLTLSKELAAVCPFEQFNRWFEEVAKTDNYDPTAMLLSTSDEKGHPDSRVVLLKGIEEGCFVFYTNYESTKSKQINHQPVVSLNFFWPFLSRQVRIKGLASKLASDLSDAYFDSRPRLSRLAAHASAQSSVIQSRETLESKMNKLIDEVGNDPILRPKNWGGYAVIPMEFEFWQGRDNRLHDRLRYIKKNDEYWLIERLEP